jgi:hypothetical protein
MWINLANAAADHAASFPARAHVCVIYYMYKMNMKPVVAINHGLIRNLCASLRLRGMCGLVLSLYMMCMRVSERGIRHCRRHHCRRRRLHWLPRPYPPILCTDLLLVIMLNVE